jgi:hypothetical protein
MEGLVEFLGRHVMWIGSVATLGVLCLSLAIVGLATRRRPTLAPKAGDPQRADFERNQHGISSSGEAGRLGRSTEQAPHEAPKLAVGPAHQREGGTAVDDEIFVADFSKGVDAWVRPNGKPAVGNIGPGGYEFGPGEGVLSKQSLQVVEGGIYEVKFSISATRDSTNGSPSNFLVGPVFYSAEGQITRWWREQPEIRVAEGMRSAVVRTKAPANATRVHLGMHGSKSTDSSSGNGYVVFSSVEMRRV